MKIFSLLLFFCRELIRPLLIVFVLFLLSSCIEIESFLLKEPDAKIDYLEKSARLDIKSFFNGDIDGFALIQDKKENIIATFTIKINGQWQEGKGIINHSFIYNDGVKNSRTWLISVDSDGSFDAVAHDITNIAKGKQAGNTAQMSYVLLLAEQREKDKQEVRFEDKMYMIDEKSMIIISKFRKHDGSSGKITISLKKAGS
jgi:hypothetical protein